MGVAAEQMKQHRGLMMVLGILLILGGIWAIGAPLASGMAVAFILGWLFVFGGIMEVIHGLQTREQVGTGGTIMTILLALVWVGAGMFILRNPFSGMVGLTLALAVVFVADGILRTFYAFELKPMKGWGWVLFSGVVGIVAGVIIGGNLLAASAKILGLIAGIRFLFEGWSMVALSLALKD
jgi:uncharacterized membrane protein HdeD (DUF308 family)